MKLNKDGNSKVLFKHAYIQEFNYCNIQKGDKYAYPWEMATMKSVVCASQKNYLKNA